MYRVQYIGSVLHLCGETALAIPADEEEEGKVFLQFDNQALVEAFGWHLFDKAEVVEFIE